MSSEPEPHDESRSRLAFMLRCGIGLFAVLLCGMLPTALAATSTARAEGGVAARIVLDAGDVRAIDPDRAWLEQHIRVDVIPCGDRRFGAMASSHAISHVAPASHSPFVTTEASVFSTRAAAAALFTSVTAGTTLEKCIRAGLEKSIRKLFAPRGYTVSMEQLAPLRVGNLGDRRIALRLLATARSPSWNQYIFFDVVYVQVGRSIEKLGVETQLTAYGPARAIATTEAKRAARILGP